MDEGVMMETEQVLLDLKKLLEPYSEGGARTLEAQVKWLLSKNLPRHHIDQAILTVFQKMHHGHRFEADDKHPAGHHLDHELLRVAQELQRAEIEDSLKRLEDFHNGLVDKHMKRGLNWVQRFGKWLFRL
jgi:hypothetical protein